MFNGYGDQVASLYNGMNLLAPHLLPPTMDRLSGKPRRIMINTDTHPTFILTEIEDTVRDGFAQFFIEKVMHLDLLRRT
jgi:hypothetical protein